ncbi:stalk domain-containing protein [Paenibacillus humicola]|uniref:stalk domain-containing protein n=1 Tax=Paenibacillus humicola TaxID=3110540 RepID=UPI00237BD50F|nr:stalk domain-containing protein [Paenibacillus humicola]
MHGSIKKFTRFAAAAAAAVLFALPAQAEGHSPPQAFSSAPYAFIGVEAGEFHSVAVRKDGSVWTWGRNLFGELGTQEHPTVGVVEAPVRLTGLSHIVSVADQLAVKSDGTVWEWGGSAGLPRQIPGLKDVRSVMLTAGAGYALQKDGGIVTWAIGGDSGGRNLKHVPIKPAAAIAGANISGIAYAVTSGGEVWWWQTAINADSGAVMISRPSKVAGLPAMKRVSAFDEQAYGVDRLGRAWSWKLASVYKPGINARYETVAGRPSLFHPELKIADISAGNGCVLLLTVSGDVYAYGRTANGKSGKISNLSGIRAIAAGWHHNLAIDGQGRIWGWGGDRWYEAGADPTSPVDGMVYRPIRASRAVTVIVNGALLDTAFPAMISGGAVQVPARAAAKSLGMTFGVRTGPDGTMTYTLKNGDRTAAFKLGDRSVLIGGTTVQIPNAAKAMPGATLVSADVLRQLGFSVNWDQSSATLAITNP